MLQNTGKRNSWKAFGTTIWHQFIKKWRRCSLIHFSESMCPDHFDQVANNLQRPPTEAMKGVNGGQNPGVLCIPFCLGLGKSGNNWN